MEIKEKIVQPHSVLKSGRVKQYVLSKGRKISQITTFCPDIIGPGPTHVYVIEDEALTLVDTGIPTRLAKKIFYYWRNQKIPPEIENLPDDFSETQLIAGLKEAGYSLEDIDQIIITHGHPDHYLLGNTIVKKGKIKVSAHVMDTDRICNPWAISIRVFQGRPRYSAMGIPLPESTAQDYHNEAAQESCHLSLQVDCPISGDGFLSIDGIQSDFIRVKHSPGHSPGSICLIIGAEEDDKKVMICGDVLLYPITPHPDDLVEYLRTLNDFEQLDGITLSLPAHGKNIRDFYGRIDFLKRHHRNRLELSYKVCREPKSPWQIASMPRYFDIFVDPNKFNPMAGNEAFTHLRLLEMVQGIYRSGIDGVVHYFRNTGEDFDQVYGRIMEIVKDRRSTVL